jgi:N-glycosylase/DNA lyase
MKIQLHASVPFDLGYTLCCGQAFRWDKRSEWWYGVVEGHVFKIQQIGDKLEFENIDARFVRNYFGLDDDLLKILSQIRKDTHIMQAIEAFKGLRILRQDPWECLISYICATYKKISAIKQMLSDLSKKFGDKIDFDGYDFYTFPTPERLAKTTAQELIKCGLGYRTKYVSESAKTVYENGFEFEGLRKIAYEKAKEALLNFPGVGSKVADCVLLFSLGKLEAFPVDVWVRRVILRYYAEHFPTVFIKKVSEKRSLSDSEYRSLSLFGREYFGEYAGYAQEYLYHYERMNSNAALQN